MNGTPLLATQATMAGLTTNALATAAINPTLTSPPLELSESRSPSSSRFLLAGTAAVALGSLLAGCGEPRPAPIANESAIPPNQSNCTPASSSPYCTGQREVLAEMHRMREEGHHSDQSLFVILGAVALIGTVSAFFLGRRRGRKSAEKAAAAQQQTQTPPAEPAQTNGPAKTDNK